MPSIKEGIVNLITLCEERSAMTTYRVYATRTRSLISEIMNLGSRKRRCLINYEIKWNYEMGQGCIHCTRLREVYHDVFSH